MKLAQLVFLGMLIHLATTNPPLDENQAFTDKILPTTTSGNFEDNMDLTTKQQEDLFYQISQKNEHSKTSFRWPNRKIPYEFSSSFSKPLRKKIKKIIKKAFKKSCVSLVPRKNEEDYVLVTRDNDGCSSYLGRVGGNQTLNLGSGCHTYGTIARGFLLATGIFDKQGAIEREEKKGKNDKKDQVEKDNTNKYGSLIRYPVDASVSKKNSRNTSKLSKAEIRKVKNLIKFELKKLRKIYEC